MADEERQRSKQTGNFVKYKIKQLVESQGDSAVRAIMAKLRRGIGKPPGSMPELWDVTLNSLPEAITGKGGKPTYGEWAVHTTLTLFALHQQGKDIKKRLMSQDGYSLGVAVRNLIQDEEDEKRIKRRFDAMATSDSMEEISHHLRGLIQLMKTKDIPLDYPELAEDLYRYQFPEARDSVRLQWGREFYRFRRNEENVNEKGR